MSNQYKWPYFYIYINAILFLLYIIQLKNWFITYSFLIVLFFQVLFNKPENIRHTCYLRLLRSVNTPILDIYESKWLSVAIVDASSINPQNYKRFSLPELLCKGENENVNFFKLFCMGCFSFSLKFYIKSNNGSNLNFKVALNAQ